MVMDTSFTEKSFGLTSFEVVSCALLPLKNAGCLGYGNEKVSLLSIEMTSDMVGLSVALSCTHRSPT